MLVPLVNPDEMASFQKGGRTTVAISNIMGFVEGYDNSAKFRPADWSRPQAR